MLKILYVHTCLTIGGVQSVRYMFLKHLNPGLFKVSVCCLGEKGEFGRKIEELGYKVDAFNQPYGLLQISTTLKLYRYLKDNNFDIVHASLFHANYHSAVASALARTRFLITEEHGEHNIHLKRRYLGYRLIGRQVARKSHLVFCCSDFVKRGIRDMYRIPEEKITVIKNLTEDKQLDIRRTKESVREELNIPPEAIIIGTLSSLYWVKNQKILIDAVSRLNGNNIFLVMVGDGPLKNELMEYSHKSGISSRVRFLGWRKDVADILNAFDIFTLPSISEGLPISLLEAMSVGLPCVASKAGGTEEVLKDSITGLLVKPNNLEELTSALKRFINDRDFAKELGSAARKHVSDHFNPSRYVTEVINVYSNLTKEKTYKNKESI